MSIYSGFVTKSQDKAYNKTVYGLIYLLQKSFLHLYAKNQKCESWSFNSKEFSKYFGKFIWKMKELESNKYQPPLFSDAFQDMTAIFWDDAVNKAKNSSKFFNMFNDHIGLHNSKSNNGTNNRCKVDCLKDESFREIHNFSNISNHSNKSDIHLKSIQNLTLSAEIGNF